MLYETKFSIGDIIVLCSEIDVFSAKPGAIAKIRDVNPLFKDNAYFLIWQDNEFLNKQKNKYVNSFNVDPYFRKIN